MLMVNKVLNTRFRQLALVEREVRKRSKMVENRLPFLIGKTISENRNRSHSNLLRVKCKSGRCRHLIYLVCVCVGRTASRRSEIHPQKKTRIELGRFPELFAAFEKLTRVCK